MPIKLPAFVEVSIERGGTFKPVEKITGRELAAAIKIEERVAIEKDVNRLRSLKKLMKAFERCNGSPDDVVLTVVRDGVALSSLPTAGKA